MAIKILGTNSGTENEVDSNTNVVVTENLPSILGGGFYTLSAAPAAIVAASLGANVTLAYINYQGRANKSMYINKIQVTVTVATVGASALVPGALSWQRFSYLGLYPTAIPIPGQQNETSIKSPVLSQASNAAITMTNASFGNYVTWTRVPVALDPIGTSFQWTFKPPYPIVLNPYEGLALRTTVAMPATQTWVYSYTIDYEEK